jgi:hypothetical protein
MKPGYQLRVGVGRAVDPNFIPRTLSNGRVCCESPAALCDKCKVHHAPSPEDIHVPSPDANALRDAIRIARGATAPAVTPDHGAVLRDATNADAGRARAAAQAEARTVPSPSVFDAIKQQRSR